MKYLYLGCREYFTFFCSSETSAAAASKKPTGFDKVQGSTLNLSNSSANKPLPQNLMVEKFSKLRVSRPIIESRLLEVHMLNKKFIPIFRMNEAMARKENEGIIKNKTKETFPFSN